MRQDVFESALHPITSTHHCCHAGPLSPSRHSISPITQVSAVVDTANRHAAPGSLSPVSTTSTPPFVEAFHVPPEPPAPDYDEEVAAAPSAPAVLPLQHTMFRVPSFPAAPPPGRSDGDGMEAGPSQGAGARFAGGVQMRRPAWRQQALPAAKNMDTSSGETGLVPPEPLQEGGRVVHVRPWDGSGGTESLFHPIDPAPPVGPGRAAPRTATAAAGGDTTRLQQPRAVHRTRYVTAHA